ncbi:MAG: Crp/Fnr family transcriptional regulator [Deltaproteobacteria bacterium]|nr:Crp/Fnr family transcriptional regulator [Deltaproteobacteria bacterium]
MSARRSRRSFGKSRWRIVRRTRRTRFTWSGPAASKSARSPRTAGEIILNLLKSGDVFGEMAFLEDSPRETFAEALDDTNMLVIKKAELLQLIKKRPAITYRLAKIIGERRKEAEKNMENFLYKGVRERLANLIVRLSNEYGIKDSRGKMLRIKITHQDLANLIRIEPRNGQSDARRFPARRLYRHQRTQNHRQGRARPVATELIPPAREAAGNAPNMKMFRGVFRW